MSVAQCLIAASACALGKYLLVPSLVRVQVKVPYTSPLFTGLSWLPDTSRGQRNSLFVSLMCG